MFEICTGSVDSAALARQLADPACGGFATFEGWVRNHHEGRDVSGLEYEVYEPLAVKEGEVVLAEALEKFDISRAGCIHAQGALDIGDMAVWVGVSAAHRDAAFDACRYIIDEIKIRLPIWKKEFYVEGDSGWVNCQVCASKDHVHS